MSALPYINFGVSLLLCLKHKTLLFIDYRFVLGHPLPKLEECSRFKHSISLSFVGYDLFLSDCFEKVMQQ